MNYKWPRFIWHIKPLSRLTSLVKRIPYSRLRYEMNHYLRQLCTTLYRIGYGGVRLHHYTTDNVSQKNLPSGKKTVCHLLYDYDRTKEKKKLMASLKVKTREKRFLHIPLYYWVRSSVRPNAYTHDDTTSLYQPTRKSPSVILLVLQPHHGSMARISFTVACATNNRISLPSMVSSYSPGSTTLCADKEIWLLYSFQSRYHVALRGTRNKYFWTVVLTFNSTQGSYPSFCPPRCPTSFYP